MTTAKSNPYAVIETLADMLQAKHPSLGNSIRAVILHQKYRKVENAVMYGNKESIKKVLSECVTAASDQIKAGERERAILLCQVINAQKIIAAATANGGLPNPVLVNEEVCDVLKAQVQEGGAHQHPPPCFLKEFIAPQEGTQHMAEEFTAPSRPESLHEFVPIDVINALEAMEIEEAPAAKIGTIRYFLEHTQIQNAVLGLKYGILLLELAIISGNPELINSTFADVKAVLAQKKANEANTKEVANNGVDPDRVFCR